jgi:ATP-binding cassette subfamily G (WHITE) protein 2 (SNQ2)
LTISLQPPSLKYITPQNYGIICAFGIGFLAMLLTATEYNTSSAFDSSVTLFKKGTHLEATDHTTDEEKLSQPATATHRTTADLKVAPEKPATNDIFTWQHIQYIVPVSGGERRLLDDVSGYVAPGKLTALMGESGAGKVCHVFCLLQLWFNILTDDVAQCFGSTGRRWGC